MKNGFLLLLSFSNGCEESNCALLKWLFAIQTHPHKTFRSQQF
jgi:hypothetical protein